MTLYCHPDKANMVTHELRRLSMEFFSYIDEENKGLMKELAQLTYLGLRLLDSSNNGIIVQNMSNSSLIL